MNETRVTSLLLALLALRPKDDLHALVQHISTAQWEQVLRQARFQRITPLLYRRLKTDAAIWDAVPPATQRQIQMRVRYSSLLSLKAHRQLVEILPLLEAQGIPVVGLKGAHLAEFVYPDRALRPMRDIDLLIHQRDLAAVDKIVRSLGYEPSGDQEWHADNHFHFAYWSEAAQFSIEIHWDIQKASSAFSVDLDSWWRSAQQKPVNKSHMLVFAPEEALIHACIHLVKHLGQDGFKPLCDVAMMLDSDTFELDWGRFVSITTAQALTNPVLLTLRLAVELLHVDVPQAVMQQWRDVTLTPSAYAWFKQQVMTDKPSEKGALVSAQFAKLWRTRNPIKKMRLLIQAIALKPDIDPQLAQKKAAEAADADPTAATESDGPLFIARLRRYSQRGWKLLRGDPELETQVDVMHWLSS